MLQPRLRFVVAWLPLAAASAVAVATLATHAPVLAQDQLLPLTVNVNGQPAGQWTLLDRSGILYAPQEAFSTWALRRRSHAESIYYNQLTWYPLASVPGFEATHNFSTRSISLQFAQTASVAPLIAQTSSVAPIAKANVPVASHAPKLTDASANPDRILPLEVRVNGAQGGQWLLLERQGILHAPQDAFDEWRLPRKDTAQPVEYRGQTFFALNTIAGYQAVLNFANQSVDLTFSPAAFSATRLATDAAVLPTLSPSVPAAFVNIDLNANYQRIAGIAATQDIGALTEFGFSNNWGVLTSSYVGQNLASSDAASPSKWRRLETSLTRDFPESKTTLRLGDSGTRPGVGARSVYFGGLQISRNYALSPGFLTQPVPVISGTSSAPSTVELYINDALRQTSNVPTGPFAIDNFPLLTGSGQVRMVVRDVLGRETVIVQPFFSHSSMLEEGLTDWSVELGKTRQNLGQDTVGYGEGFVSGLWRYGLNKSNTVETTAQLGRDTRNIGLGISSALPLQVLGYASLAASKSADAAGLQTTGHEWSIGAEYTNIRHGFSGRLVTASQNYRQLGQLSSTLPHKQEGSLNYNYSSERFGAIGMGAASIDTYDRGRLTTLSANYSLKIGERTSLAFTASKVAGASSGNSLGMSLNIPLENRRSSSTNVNIRAGKTDAYTTYSQALPGETGVGWRSLAGSRGGALYGEAGVYYQGNKALLTADASTSAGQQAVRAGLQTALVWMDGQVLSTRRVQDSFALVEVPGYANIGVGFQGGNQTRTDGKGFAFVQRLQPYQNNSIRLDPSELPINAEIDNIEQIAVPAARSGVKVVFPVRGGQAALLKIVLDDKDPAPAGAEIELIGDSKEFFVARRGEAFITGLQAKNTLRLKHKGRSCTLNVDMPPVKNPDDIVRMGPLLCTGVQR